SPYISQISTPTSILSKRVSIRLAGVNKYKDYPYTKFKFFSTDTENDIHQEISRAFSVERFSLVNEKEDCIITGSWYSLEDNTTYSLIKRDSTDAKKNWPETDENENLAEDDICNAKKARSNRASKRTKFETSDDMKISSVINDIQVFKPIIKSNIDLTTISEFVSIDSTFSPGTSATAYIEVDRLLSLLEKKKTKIDCILQSQHVYAFEVIEKLVAPTDPDVNNSNSAQGSSSSNDTSPPGNNVQNGSFSSDDTSPSGNSAQTGSFSITSASRIVTRENLEIFQEFDIVAAICANVTQKQPKILEFFVDVKDCGMGPMLSENSSLHKLGLGYFLDSVIIEVSPAARHNRMIIWKAVTQPEQQNRVTKVSTSHEKSKGIKGQVSGTGIKMGVSYDKKKMLNTEKMGYEWEIKLDGCLTTGVRWSYFREDDSYTNNFAPSIHTGKWHILDKMNGFTIKITQVVDFKFSCKNWIKKPKLIKQCPKMAHVLKISFDNLNNFDEYFEELNTTHYEQNDLIYNLKNKDFHNEDTRQQEGINDFTVTRSFLKRNE
ncbi:26145_t:CDS:2, partial [Dentiscutata erythropus]